VVETWVLTGVSNVMTLFQESARYVEAVLLKRKKPHFNLV